MLIQMVPVKPGDLARFSKTGCGTCHGAGGVVDRAFEDRNKPETGKFSRCHCVDKKLKAAGLAFAVVDGKPFLRVRDIAAIAR